MFGFYLLDIFLSLKLLILIIIIIIVIIITIISVIIIIIITIDSSKRHIFAKVFNSLPKDIRNISDKGFLSRGSNHYFNTVAKDRQLFIYLHSFIFSKLQDSYRNIYIYIYTYIYFRIKIT